MRIYQGLYPIARSPPAHAARTAINKVGYEMSRNYHAGDLLRPQRLPEELQAVSNHLKGKGGVWTTPAPDYTNFSRMQLLTNLEDIRRAISTETNATNDDIETAHVLSERFINGSFDFFEGKRTIDRAIARVFAVPMRSDRTDETYASESIPFVPLYDPSRFGVNSDIRMRAIYGIPPTVLDTYTRSDADDESGALVLVPIYADMPGDLWPDKNDFRQAEHLACGVGKILHEVTVFAHQRLGADLIGLGATLSHPSITDFGRLLRNMPGMQNLTTTTGHGGTVSMIVESARQLMEQGMVESNGKIGIIGAAGSIGWSSIMAACCCIPDHRFIAYDIRQERLRKLVAESSHQGRIAVADSAQEVFRDTSIILSALTGEIDLSSREYRDVDLVDKVIVDDSQPACFKRTQVESKGGHLIWVVGEDGSETKFMTRDGLYTGGVGYNYGDESGLYGKNSEFACGLEAAVVAQSGDHRNAIQGPVTPENVHTIRSLFNAAGVRLAPFQAFGKPVYF